MSIYKRGNVWWMNVYVGAGRRRIRRSTGSGDKVVARIVEQSVVAACRRITPKRRLMAIIDNVMPDGEKSLALREAPEYYRRCVIDEGRVMSEASLRRRTSLLSKFAQWAQRNSQIDYVEEVSPPLAFSFAKSLPEKLSAKTKNDYIGDLGTAWKLFMRHDKAQTNPWPLVRFQRSRVSERTGRAFTGDEISRILAAAERAGHDWPTAIMIGLYTGLRQGDAVSLRWADIDFEKRMIFCCPAKTARSGIVVRIPLHDALADWLQKHRNDSEFVAPARVGRVGRTKFRDGDSSFGQLLADAGIARRSEREKLSFHCLRHTFVSRLAEAGVAQDVRMRLVGHTSAENHAIYTHDDASARAAIDALPAFSYTLRTQENA